MSRIVLIHGSWHGAWCWHKVVPRLRALGHDVIAPDLPSHGRDRTPPGDVVLNDYVECIAPLLTEQTAPCTVVAHSRGGVVLAALSERFPTQIHKAIYLAAILLKDGEKVFDLLPMAEGSLLLPAMYQADDGSWDMLREDAYVPALYADCTADDIELCRQLLTPEPLAPSLTPIDLTDDRFGRVRRAYIELTQDRAVTHAWQRAMLARVPCAETRSIAASHSAYFSRPEELARHIHELTFT